MTLTLVRGLPGSGKSTYAKTLNCFHIEADMFHMNDGTYEFDAANLKKAHELCQKFAKTVLESGADVVVSNTFTQYWELKPYIDMALQLQASIKVVEMKEDYGNVHNVPSEVISTMKERWEEIDLSLLS